MIPACRAKERTTVDAARERLNESDQTGADVQITACPQSIENFSDARPEYFVPRD